MRKLLGLLLLSACAAFGQSEGAKLKQEGPPAPAAPVDGRVYTVEAGTRILLSLASTVSTKSAAVGDRVYLETAFPVVQDGRIVIPAGSYVTGTVTSVKRAGKVKGRAELYLRFDSLILPSGVTRDFRASLGGIDGSNNEQLDRNEGKVSGEGNKSGDATKIAEAAGWGTAVGGIAARTATGAGLGAAAGAAAGLVGVLLSRGPDAVLERGSTVEMVLDRNIRYTEEEVKSNPSTGRGAISPEQQKQKSSGWLRQ